MKAKEIRQMSAEELRQKSQEARRELFNLRFQRATEQLEKPAKLHHIRKDIARIETVIREKERSAAKPA
ncbi:MAG: 50S ribosomal protein L29 [Planctomycetota bacterium]